MLVEEIVMNSDPSRPNFHTFTISAKFHKFGQISQSWNTYILLVYLCILEYLELGQFRNFCDVFHPEKAKKTTTKIKMTFHNSAHCGKSWAQLSFSPLARALRNVEKEGLESPSCMNASIWKEWKCIKCKFLCGIESRLPGCAESIFFPGARWHLSGCLGKHCWRLSHNTNDSMKNNCTIFTIIIVTLAEMAAKTRCRSIS